MAVGFDLSTRLVKSMESAPASGVMLVTSTLAHSAADPDLLLELLYGAQPLLSYKTSLCRLETSFPEPNLLLLKRSIMVSRCWLKISGTDSLSRVFWNGVRANLSYHDFQTGYPNPTTHSMLCSLSGVELICSTEMFCSLIYQGGLTECEYFRRRSSPPLRLAMPAYIHPAPPVWRVNSTLFQSTDALPFIHSLYNCPYVKQVGSCKLNKDLVQLPQANITWCRQLLRGFPESFFFKRYLFSCSPLLLQVRTFKLLCNLNFVGSRDWYLSPSMTIISASSEEWISPPYLFSMKRDDFPDLKSSFGFSFLSDEGWFLTSLYVTICLLFDFVVKATSTHSSFVLNPLSSSHEELSHLCYNVVVYAFNQRGWIISSVYCNESN